MPGRNDLITLKEKKTDSCDCVGKSAKFSKEQYQIQCCLIPSYKNSYGRTNNPKSSVLLYVSDEIGCADPQTCKDICDNESGCSNIAFPLLVLNIMPTG